MRPSQAVRKINGAPRDKRIESLRVAVDAQAEGAGKGQAGAGASNEWNGATVGRCPGEEEDASSPDGQREGQRAHARDARQRSHAATVASNESRPRNPRQ